ncbi:MAG TPA: stage 0 sporulation family protein [Tenericutes bacterium]|nr:stage 0 sporulation family protein [Mycoplasmatota bacterium]
MIKVVGVTFKEKGKIYFFKPNGLELKNKIDVIVKTEKGQQYGKIEKELFEIDEEKINTPINEVIRIATKDDYLKNLQNINDAKKALIVCRKKVETKKLNMQILNAYYSFDREQLTFNFLSDNRVDFRDLVKDLAAIYKTRIELRQIGVRDKAKEIGGCGPCGRGLCCSKFLNELDSVTINMAKNQNISLNPNKINGVCGRLLCCLKYENECYLECKKGLPKIGKIIQTEKGEGKVISVDILRRAYKVDIPNEGIVEFIEKEQDGSC